MDGVACWMLDRQDYWVVEAVQILSREMLIGSSIKGSRNPYVKNGHADR